MAASDTHHLWTQAIRRLADSECALLGLWADGDVVHMAMLDRGSRIERVSYRCTRGSYPSVGASHAPALRLERAIRDLHGLQAAGSPDTRAWLDHCVCAPPRTRAGPPG